MVPDSTPLPTADRVLTRGLLLVMAIATGCAVANLYYNQPMLGLIGRDLGHGADVGLVAMATQLGYAGGIVLLVPLGDRMNRRSLVLVQCAALAAAITAAALAPTLAILVLASFAIGVCATLAQQIIPFAADLAPPAARGRTVGIVMSGLLSGILLGRAVSGAIGQAFGWRAMLWLSAGIAVLIGLVLAARLPTSRPTSTLSYPRLLRSLGTLVRTLPPLRRAALIQGSLFGAFSVFWSTLALLLQGAPYHLGSTVAGLFGVLGLAGVAGAPYAGRIADRRGPDAVVGIGILTVVGAFLVFGLWRSLAGLIAGVLLLDLGVQMTNIANQAAIFALGEAARSRINTVYVTGLFLGGALGSAAGSLAWRQAGWSAVSAVGAALAVFGLAVHLLGRRRPG